MFFLLGDEAEHITICSNLSDAGQLKGYPSWMQPQPSNRAQGRAVLVWAFPCASACRFETGFTCTGWLLLGEQ